MAKRKASVAVLGGGYSDERSIALESARAVHRWLAQAGYNPYLIDVQQEYWLVEQGEQYIPLNRNDFTVELPNQGTVKFDAAVIAIHGTPGEDGLIQGYLDLLNIPYTTGDTLCEALSFHKAACKAYLTGIVPMAEGVQIIGRAKADVYQLERQLGYPMFVKPNTNGSSVGVSKAHNRAQLVTALKAAFQLGDDVLVEGAVDGTEVSCGLVELAGQLTVFPITELVSPDEFFTLKAKYDGSTQEITPARIAPEVARQIATYSRAIYRRLRCRGIARIDYIIKEGIPHFLEINTVPGMTAESIVPRQVRAMGQTMPDILSLLLHDLLGERDH